MNDKQDQTTPEQMIAQLRAKLPEEAPAVRLHCERAVNEYVSGTAARFCITVFAGDSLDILAQATCEDSAEDAIRVVLLQLSIKWQHLGLLAVPEKCEQVESEAP